MSKPALLQRSDGEAKTAEFNPKRVDPEKKVDKSNNGRKKNVPTPTESDILYNQLNNLRNKKPTSKEERKTSRKKKRADKTDATAPDNVSREVNKEEEEVPKVVAKEKHVETPPPAVANKQYEPVVKGSDQRRSKPSTGSKKEKLPCGQHNHAPDIPEAGVSRIQRTVFENIVTPAVVLEKKYEMKWKGEIEREFEKDEKKEGSGKEGKELIYKKEQEKPKKDQDPRSVDVKKESELKKAVLSKKKLDQDKDKDKKGKEKEKENEYPLQMVVSEAYLSPCGLIPTTSTPPSPTLPPTPTTPPVTPKEECSHTRSAYFQYY